MNSSDIQVIDDSIGGSPDPNIVQQEKEIQMLDLINRVQMFQIATSRVNHNLLSRKKIKKKSDEPFEL